MSVFSHNLLPFIYRALPPHTSSPSGPWNQTHQRQRVLFNVTPGNTVFNIFSLQMLLELEKEKKKALQLTLFRAWAGEQDCLLCGELLSNDSTIIEQLPVDGGRSISTELHNSAFMWNPEKIYYF